MKLSPLSSLSTAALMALTASLIWVGSACAEPLSLSADDQAAVDATSDQVELAPNLRRQVVDYSSNVAAGSVVIDTAHTYLYYVLGDGRAIRYGIGVGREGFTWSGVQSVTRKAEWPDWIPPAEMIARQPYLARVTAGGPGNPLGARAIYLGNTVYRIHGTNLPETIGQNVSSGCIRMQNADVIDLYRRVTLGAKVIVLPNNDTRVAISASPAMPMRVAAH